MVEIATRIVPVFGPAHGLFGLSDKMRFAFLFSVNIAASLYASKVLPSTVTECHSFLVKTVHDYINRLRSRRVS